VTLRTTVHHQGNHARLAGRIVGALAAGALLANVHGLAPAWWLAWLAPVPLLVAVTGASRGVALLCGALAGIISGASMYSYLVELAGAVPVIVIALSKALVWSGGALAARAALRNLPPVAAVFVFPLLMTGIEAMVAAFSPHGTAGALAYSQMSFLPVLQVASLGGAPAVTFVTLLFASLLATVLTTRAWIVGAAPALIVALALAYGAQRLRTPAPAESVAVTLLAADRFEGVPGDWRPVWSAYATEVFDASRRGARIVLLPEKIVRLGDAELDGAVDEFAAIARKSAASLVVGVEADAPHGPFNRAYLISPGGPPATYDKRHMIPGLESRYTPGTAQLVSGEPPARRGLAICKDMDFPAIGRSLASSDLVLVPAWDFDVDAWLHSRMAMLRGVENGYAVVRSARNGALTVSDAYGRVLAETPSGPMAVLDARVPLGGGGPTLYSGVGDAFGWACLGLAGLLLAWAWLRNPATTRRIRLDP
jgi:apolipoprotein N-acyltransferase